MNECLGERLYYAESAVYSVSVVQYTCVSIQRALLEDIGTRVQCWCTCNHGIELGCCCYSASIISRSVFLIRSHIDSMLIVQLLTCVILFDQETFTRELLVGWLVEWGFYALSASKAIFRARTYNCNLFSPVMMIT